MDTVFDEETKEDEDAISNEVSKEAVSATPVPTSTKLLQLRILKKNPSPILAKTQLLGLLPWERAHIVHFIEPSLANRNPMKFLTIDDMVRLLQLHAITTPAIGKCMVVAIVQSICDADLAAQAN